MQPEKSTMRNEAAPPEGAQITGFRLIANSSEVLWNSPKGQHVPAVVRGMNHKTGLLTISVKCTDGLTRLYTAPASEIEEKEINVSK